MRIGLVGLCACVVLVAGVPPRQQGAPQVAWRPELPKQGSLVVVGVRAAVRDSFVAVAGELGGVPLKFERFGAWFQAVGGVPLDARERLPVRIVVDRADGTHDTLATAMVIAVLNAPRSRLRVAQRFVDPPDSLAPRLRAEQEVVRDLKRRALDPPRLWSGRFAPPRPNPVIARFGVTRTYNGRVTSRHLGVDFASPKGATVRATNDAVVAYVGDFYYNGTSVFLHHGAGLLTGYLHLTRALVAPGDTVRRGQPVGEVGSTGRSVGPHLHWFASYGEVTVDPLDLLTLDLGSPLHAR